MFPTYRYSRRSIAGLVANVLFGGKRSFRQDGVACMARLQPPLQVLGSENIPSHGPGLLLFNHYYRPGFSAWWMAFALAAAIPVDIHFIMTGELTYPGKWYAPLGMAASRWVLRRISQAYGFSTMPPMPPRPQDVASRARSVRQVLEYAAGHPQALLALAPEGGDQPGGVLSRPPSGAGRFISHLTGGGKLPIYPVGVYEEAGHLCLNFGPAVHLVLPAGLSADEKDHQVSELVMRKLAPLLPARLRGEFE